MTLKKKALLRIGTLALLMSSFSVRGQEVPQEIKNETLSSEEQHTVTGWNFDWDDNIAFMPTVIVVYNKANPKLFIDIPTGDFAKVRSLIGVPAVVGKSSMYKGVNLSKYTLMFPEEGKEVTETTENSYKYFRDSLKEGENYFLNDLKKVLGGSGQDWQGPVWNDLVYALSDKKRASRTTVITARGHSPEAIHEGVLYLVEQGLLKYPVPLENIFPVSNPEIAKRFGGSPKETSLTKAKVIMHILDEMQRLPISDMAAKALNSDGTAYEKLHNWGFSDDDFKNFETSVKLLSAEVANKRWPKIKINVFYTAHRGHEQDQQSLVIMSNGKTREQTKAEKSEGFFCENKAKEM